MAAGLTSKTHMSNNQNDATPDGFQSLQDQISQLAQRLDLTSVLLSTVFAECAAQKRALMVVLRELGGLHGFPGRVDISLENLIASALAENENEVYLEALETAANRLTEICRLGAAEAQANQFHQVDTEKTH